MNRIKIANFKERGDTIVEVLIAMAVLGMVLGTAFAIANRSYAVGVSAQERTEAVKIADSQIELLRLGSEVTNSTILDPVLSNELFCVDPNAADLSRVVYNGTAQEITGSVDPITYPASNECSFGTDGRYKVSIEQSGADNEIYSIRVRWESVLGGSIEEVNHVYRTYDFEGSYSLIAPTLAIVDGCTDPLATNFEVLATPGNPDEANCTYPVVNGCTDSSAFNYNPSATPGNPDSSNCDYSKPLCNADTSSGQPYIYFWQGWINPTVSYTTARIIAWTYSSGYGNSDIIDGGFVYSTSSTELTIESLDSGAAFSEANDWISGGIVPISGYSRATISNLRPSKTYYSRAFIETADCVAYGPTNTINTRTLSTSRYRFIADRGSSSYYLSNNRTTWTTARYYARAYEGNLATISNIQENNFIRNNARPLLPQNSSLQNDSWIWLGLNDRSSEGNFVWDSGQNSNFRNWYNPQPDNYLNNEDYVHMNMDVNGRWNDITNGSSMRYIIEYEGL